MNRCKECIHFREVSSRRWDCFKKGLRFDTASDAIGCMDDFEPRPKDIPYHQVNNPIQITHTIVDPSTGYHEAVELLTVLYQDGTIMQGRCTAGYGEHTWQEIALPPRKPAGKSE